MIIYLKTIKNILDSGRTGELTDYISNLYQFTDNLFIKEIIDAIERKNYLKAKVLITDFLNNQEKPVAKGDIDLTGLRTESMLLETQLSVLHSRKAELQKVINDFRIRHNSELGMIIGEILKLRMLNLAKQKDTNPDNGQKYQEAKKDYKSFEDSKKTVDIRKFQKIDIASKKILQKKFREASKLCHPDLIADELKTQASKIFVDLHQAYLANDLKKIEEILALLKGNDLNFASKSSTINELQKLKTHITTLKSDIITLKNEIDLIESSSALSTINSIEDWNLYFDGLNEKFTLELEKLKKQYAGEE